MMKAKNSFTLDNPHEVEKIIPLIITAIDTFVVGIYSKINDMSFVEMEQTNLALKSIINEIEFFIFFFHSAQTDEGRFEKIIETLNQMLDRCYSAQAYCAMKFVLYQRKKYQRRLRQARKALGLTQEAVASKLGISRNTYTMYETGKRDISTLALAQLAVIFNQSTDWLLGIKD